MFFAGVKPLEHGAHSFYIERYPEGREATVVWGALDLRFLNDSGHAIYIRTRATTSTPPGGHERATSPPSSPI